MINPFLNPPPLISLRGRGNGLPPLKPPMPSAPFLAIHPPHPILCMFKFPLPGYLTVKKE